MWLVQEGRPIEEDPRLERVTAAILGGGAKYSAADVFDALTELQQHAGAARQEMAKVGSAAVRPVAVTRVPIGSAGLVCSTSVGGAPWVQGLGPCSPPWTPPHLQQRRPRLGADPSVPGALCEGLAWMCLSQATLPACMHNHSYRQHACGESAGPIPLSSIQQPAAIPLSIIQRHLLCCDRWRCCWCPQCSTTTPSQR